MAKRLESLSLPPFAFVEGWGDSDPLQGRCIIAHCPTGTIMEAVPRTDLIYVEPGTFRVNFDYTNIVGATEPWSMLLHVSPSFDPTADRATLRQLLFQAAKWFGDYMDWEDAQP